MCRPVRERTVAAERMFPVSLFGLFLSIPCLGLPPGVDFLSLVIAMVKVLQCAYKHLGWELVTFDTCAPRTIDSAI